jgi:hypothetical protein
VWSGGLLWQESNSAYLSSRIRAIETKLPKMATHVEKVLEAAIARGIEQLHATVESTMARFLAHANAGVQRQTCGKTNIDTTAMATVPTIVVGADQQLHIGSDPIKLGVGNGSEVNATNGQAGLAHVSKVC